MTVGVFTLRPHRACQMGFPYPVAGLGVASPLCPVGLQNWIGCLPLFLRDGHMPHPSTSLLTYCGYGMTLLSHIAPSFLPLDVPLQHGLGHGAVFMEQESRCCAPAWKWKGGHAVIHSIRSAALRVRSWAESSRLGSSKAAPMPHGGTDSPAPVLASACSCSLGLLSPADSVHISVAHSFCQSHREPAILLPSALAEVLVLAASFLVLQICLGLFPSFLCSFHLNPFWSCW